MPISYAEAGQKALRITEFCIAMSDWNDTNQRQSGFGTVPRSGDVAETSEVFDAGLRKHMLKIYNYMASGVLLSGVVAMLAYSSGAAVALASGPLFWIVALAPLAFVMLMSFGANKFSQGALQVMFWAFATIMGLSLSFIFLRFTGESIAATFFATTGAFAGLSLFGYTTKKDLSGFGTFLIMGVIGLFGMAISFIGVLIFAGLTAYDTQRLKREYMVLRGTDFAGKAVILGALSLYLDFINMFQFLLSFMGSQD
jgi:FtsH-binding integral membrane protein